MALAGCSNAAGPVAERTTTNVPPVAETPKRPPETPKLDQTRWKAKATLGRLEGSAWTVAFSPDGKLIAAGGGQERPKESGEAKIWETNSGAVFGTYRTPTFQVNAIAFSPDGKVLATAGQGEGTGATTLWDVASGRERLTLEDSSSLAVCFSRDGESLAIGPRGAKIFDPLTGTLKASLNVVAINRGMAFSPDGRRLLVGTTLWDIATDKKLLQFPSGGDRSVTFSPDGSRVAIAGRKPPTKIWDAQSGQELVTLDALEAHAVAYSLDGAVIATGHGDGTIRVWNASTGKELAAFNEGNKLVWGLAFAPDGVTLASGDFDGAVKLWEAGRE